MNPYLIGLQAFATLQGMRSAKSEAQLQQQQLDQEAKQLKLRGIETHNARMRDLDVALSTNAAVSAFQGRSDRSLDAINKRLRADAATDVSRSASNVAQQISQLRFAQGIAGVRGKNKARAILLDGLSSGYSNHLRFKDVEGS